MKSYGSNENQPKYTAILIVAEIEVAKTSLLIIQPFFDKGFNRDGWMGGLGGLPSGPITEFWPTSFQSLCEIWHLHLS